MFRNHKNQLCVFLHLVSLFMLSQNAAFVNPFIGTSGTGHTFPGAVKPFGMVQLSPDTRIDGSWEGCSGYHYSDSIIYGFSHTHLSGTGVSDWGDILLIPSNANLGPDSRNYAVKFKHTDEQAKAGNYSVTLANKIKINLTATERTGIHQYTYPTNKTFVFLDLLHRDKLIEGNLNLKDSFTITGFRISSSWANRQYCYFAARFSHKIKSLTYTANRKFVELASLKKNEFPDGVLIEFDNSDKSPLLIKVGLSNVDEKGAYSNLITEALSNDFNYYSNTAFESWDKQLSKIHIRETDNDKRTIFYTALYHCFIHPSLDMDVDGRYRGRDNQIHQASGFLHYNVFSLWDTYRALHPLFTLLEVNRTRDFIRTFMVQYEEAKRLPVWELSSNETDCMIGYHSVSVITDAYVKGISDFDARKAFKAMLEAARYEKFGISKFYDKKYLEINDESESVSKSLEYAYDNWCIAKMGSLLNESSEQKKLLRSAQAYKNLFDASTGFMRPRINGNWYSPFNPYEINNHYTEGNSWHYSFYVPHDIDGLIKLHGGDHKFEKKLDELFSASSKTTGRKQVDVTGLIGQYAHGNEPSHHTPFLYHYVGKPDKTFSKVSKIISLFYKNTADGLIGNDDCGQLSAWYVLASMGLYQVCPGIPEYVFFQPQFSEIEINFESGNKMKIASELNPNKVLAGYKLNEVFQEKSYLTHHELESGGILQFVYKLKTDTSAHYGKLLKIRPKTALKDFDIVPAPIISYSSKAFKNPQMVKLLPINISGVKLSYSTTGKSPSKNQVAYSKPFIISVSTQIQAKCYTLNDSSDVTVANLFRINPDLFVKLNAVPNKQYEAGGPQALVDGIYGDPDWRKGDWHGYQGQDFEAVLELKSLKSIKEVSVNFLQDTRSWIIFPKEVLVHVSLNGKDYTLLPPQKIDIPADDYQVQTKKLNFVPEKPFMAKYVKITAKNFGKLPDWHDGRGGEAFIFVDEIEVR